jgi:hypothetical protein
MLAFLQMMSDILQSGKKILSSAEQNFEVDFQKKGDYNNGKRCLMA